LAAQQLGWLASTITNEKMSRGQKYLVSGVIPPMPELEAGEYLLDALKELGPIRSNGMGLGTPDWQELVAFASANDLALQPWEFRLIRKMASAYLSGFNSGKEPLSIPPIERE
jgi:hypothetical protein